MARFRSATRKRKGKSYLLHKPRGQFSSRVQAVGPEHFGIVCVDGAKARSKLLLTDFFGTVLIPPTEFAHDHSSLCAVQQQPDPSQPSLPTPGAEAARQKPTLAPRQNHQELQPTRPRHAPQRPGLRPPQLSDAARYFG